MQMGKGGDNSLAADRQERHQLIRGGCWTAQSPIFLVHIPERWTQPGRHEIKPLRTRAGTDEREKFQRDVQKLIAFRRASRPVMSAAFFLVFGRRLSERAKDNAGELQSRDRSR